MRQHLRSEEDSLFGEHKNQEANKNDSKVKRNGRIPKLAPYVSKRFKIRLTYKGKPYFARVRSNGLINFHGKIYTSPSLAAIAAMKRRTANGWSWWHYERSPRDWVRLDELRKK